MADLTKLGNDIQEKQTELTTLEAQLAQLLGNETIDTITAKIETLNQEIASLQTDKENAEKENTIAKGKIGALESTVASLRRAKYWALVGRVDNVWGDRNLFCACVPLSELAS